MHSIETFTRLDRTVQSAPRDMPDDMFDVLVQEWTDAANAVMREPAMCPNDVAEKLSVVARVIGEMDEIGPREMRAVRTVFRDAERLAKGL